MKKLFLLAALVLFAFAMTACAEKKFAAPSLNAADSAVELTLYAFDAESEKVPGLMNLGHAFVSAKNVSGSPVKVGAYALAANEEVSFGTWGMNAHWGIWYNVESTYMTLGRYDGRVSLTQGLTLSEIDVINAYLLGADDWTPFKNCSYFAVDVWNLASDDTEYIDLGGLITPERVSKRIEKTDSYAYNRAIESFGKVGYYDESADAFMPYALRA